MGKITDKWRKKAEVYKLFLLSDPSKYDLSEDAAQQMFDYESSGKGNLVIDCFESNSNGFAQGKKWMNVTLSSWREDIVNGLLFKFELYADPKFTNVHWWLDEVLKDLPPRGNIGDKKVPEDIGLVEFARLLTRSPEDQLIFDEFDK